MKKYSYIIAGIALLITGGLWLQTNHYGAAVVPAQRATASAALQSTSTEPIIVETRTVRASSTQSQKVAVATTAAPIATTHVPPQHSSYVIPVVSHGTVLAAMQIFASSSADFTFGGHDYPSLGYFVTSINGKSAGDGKNWMLYVNQILSPKGASTRVVDPGDIVEWRFENNY